MNGTRSILAVALAVAVGCGDGDSGADARPPVPDAGAPDAGETDATPADAGADAAPLDAAPVDAPPVDAAPIDAPPIDAPPTDAPPIDAPPIDAPPVDAPPIDAPPIDAPPIDAPPIDAPPIDAPVDASWNDPPVGGGLAVADDPLLRMPGTQPADGVDLEAPNQCFNCHGGYDPAVEPGHGWRGSMMAQAARDPLFWAAFTVALQDSVWATGDPNAGDLCLRCHLPGGWLGGRSQPPNAAAMTGSDFDGVTCDACHRMYDPFFEDTFAGLREGSDWTGYWDEAEVIASPSSAEAALTLDADRAEAAGLTFFDGDFFYDGSGRPVSIGYTENGGGQYFVAASTAKRGPFADDDAKHPRFYSRYHKSRYVCSSCHDVSNPVLHNLGFEGTTPGDGQTVLPSEQDPAYSYFHVERTFSEFMLSAYGQQGGAPGTGAFAPGVFDTSLPNDWIGRCQDCHMADGAGRGCNKNSAPLRPGSPEHPASGVPTHDLTGGNAWIPWILASTVPSSPNHDPVNQALLTQGPSILTLDLSAGMALEPTALLAAADRAVANLQRAATIENLSYQPGSGALSFRIRNHTGHKLISGYPEGRRLWVNVRVYAGATLLEEINPYDAGADTLAGLAHPSSPPLGAGERHVDALVYEAALKSTLAGLDHSFHMVLADGRYKDNRIPPQGFRIADAAARLSEPVWQGNSAPGYFTAAEYAGGWDDVALTVPAGANRVEVRVYYQTVSREYVEFLRDEIVATASTLPAPTPSGRAVAYIVQSDPYFAALRAWGDVIWQLWDHNRDVPGAAPVLVTEAFTQP